MTKYVMLLRGAGVSWLLLFAILGCTDSAWVDETPAMVPDKMGEDPSDIDSDASNSDELRVWRASSVLPAGISSVGPTRLSADGRYVSLVANDAARSVMFIIDRVEGTVEM